MADKRIDQPTGTETMGHEWDGIEELNTPLPRWWLWAFYASIAWAAVYVVLYPAWPLVHSATAGVLGWTSTGQLEAELQQQRAARAPLMRAIADTPIEQLGQHPQLMQAAIEGGRAAFKVSCTQCHGSGAAGSKGYPNLNDDDWLWGGDIATIQYTIEHGVRQPDHDATRMSQMPAFGKDGILKSDQIADLVAHVRTISGQQKPDAASRRGAVLFEQNCTACHGPDGKGSRAVGAPNLTDAIWLYGGDADSIAHTIANSRYGVMPRWGNHLDPVTIKMLAAYVHSLGGGEQAPKPELAEAGATNNGRP
ncbi:cytochrome-c oxidase, cbb3-type subunit III [Sphingomonas sp. MAH-20]|uniref:Cbb3-type cytochrome c oxidase subunit n=1 Tax=Sphingomonas horti TaxID=2682842 RepID=A0A6I4J183_9SPHN|nr:MULTISPECIES: cytochrome-c oxidase, cbb3-type subunit III [Sphingomonas]MBA2919971.1 cytochrome-c oxidase, cbb3-type subunit III [Sphingomonas sp. CGMCC 1.13658]MVO77853.1 cytochrome-c oxidase, cbb3-type subunit III [Sphingomonas horti]